MFNFLIRKSRTAYKLPNGTYADPLQAYRALLKGGISSLLDLHDDADKWDEAEEAICRLIRTVFNLTPLHSVSGAGSTDEDCLALYVDFMSHLEKKGLRAQTSRTTVPVTVPQETPL